MVSAMLFSVCEQGAIAAEYSEDAVKAAFLYRFASYVEWPAGAIANEPFTIGVLDGDGVAAALEKLVPALEIQNLPVRVVKITARRDLESAHIVYVGVGALARADALLAAIPGHPVLVVTDGENDLQGASAINFIRVGSNIRFEVSLSAAESRQLKIASGLLSVAARVKGRPRAGIFCHSLRWWEDALLTCPKRFAVRSEPQTRLFRPPAI